MTDEADAVVVGAGPNGLVAANVLADQGWRVEVLEAREVPGGAVHSGHRPRVPAGVAPCRPAGEGRHSVCRRRLRADP
ncbi:NAD(P)-binding protein (plasmid) [Embleya sp. NBC_00896]|nr:NAD(P)-binding protein [Embleya sp. NBC_00896]